MDAHAIYLITISSFSVGNDHAGAAYWTKKKYLRAKWPSCSTPLLGRAVAVLLGFGFISSTKALGQGAPLVSPPAVMLFADSEMLAVVDVLCTLTIPSAIITPFLEHMKRTLTTDVAEAGKPSTEQAWRFDITLNPSG